MQTFVEYLNDLREEDKKKNKRRRRSTGYKVIEGKILLGLVQGQASLEFDNGCTFKGKVDCGDIEEGELTYPDGVIYTGKFMNAVPHGPGKLLHPNGTQYVRTFKIGVAADSALITYKNGDMYKGPIQNFKKHGLGKLFFKNGDKYVGDFKNRRHENSRIKRDPPNQLLIFFLRIVG